MYDTKTSLKYAWPSSGRQIDSDYHVINSEIAAVCHKIQIQ